MDRMIIYIAVIGALLIIELLALYTTMKVHDIWQLLGRPRQPWNPDSSNIQKDHQNRECGCSSARPKLHCNRNN